MDIKFSTTTNKPVITGESGINPEDYLKYHLIKENNKISKIETDTIKLDNVTASYTSYTGKMNDFKSICNTLRGAPVVSADYSLNVFAKSKITVSSSNQAASPGENFLTVDPDVATTEGVYKLRIVNLATAKNHIYGGFATDNTDVVTSAPGFFSPGDFTINGETVSVIVGDTLRTINTKINTLAAPANVYSKVIKKTSSEYVLGIYGKTTGVANAFVIADPSNVLSQLTPTVNIAHDASLYFNDILIERTENTIDDFDSEIQLKVTLLAESGAVDIFINSSPNTDLVEAAIRQFVDYYNEIQRFAYIQSERDPKSGKFKETAVLGRESEFITSNNELLQLLRTPILSADPLVFDSLEDIGIEIKSYKGSTVAGDTPINNALQFKDSSGKFMAEQVRTVIDDVRKLFSLDYTSSSANLIITRTTNKITATSFTIDADLSRPMVAVTGGMAQDKVRIIVDGQTYRPNFKNGEIIAPAGSPIDGMNLYYNGNGPETVTVTLTQGFADKLFNYLSWFVANDYFTGSSSKVDDLLNGQKQYDGDGNVVKKQEAIYGGITLINDKLKREKTRKEQDLQNIQDKTDRKRDKLEKDFAKNEAKIAKSKAELKNLEDDFMAQYGKR